MGEEKDVEIRVLSQKVKIMADLFDFWKKERYGHLRDQYDQLLAQQMWTPIHVPDSGSPNVQTDGCSECHHNDPDTNLMEEHEKLKQRVVDLEQQLQCARKESRKRARRLSLRIERVSEDRDKLHVQNLRLLCDLKLRDSKIQEFMDIFDRSQTHHSTGT